MADIKASGPALEQAHADLVHSGNKIEELLAALETEVATLRDAWSGEASEAYDVAQRTWSANLREMRRLVAHYGVRVSDVDARYRAASRTIGDKIWR